MSLAPAMGKAWRTIVASIAAVSVIAAVMILAAAPEGADAQQAVTCYAIADSNEPGNLNSEGQVDTLILIENALVAPQVSVIGGNGGLGTGDAEAMALRQLPDNSFEAWGWESGANLFRINTDNADVSDAGFDIPGKVEGLTWSGTNDDVAGNDLLWASYGSPANQVAAYTANGLLAAGPFNNVESGALNSIVDIAWDPTTGLLFGIITDDSDTTDVIQIGTADGSVTSVGGTDIDMEGLGFTPGGQMVGSTGNDGANAFHLINKANGNASLQSDLSAITGAFDFESVDCVDEGEPPPPLPPLVSICYAIADSQSNEIGDQNSPDTLVRVDTSNGTTNVVGQLGGGTTVSVEAFAIRPTVDGPVLYGFDPDTGNGQLFIIDENDASIQVLASGLGALGDVDGMTFSGVDDGDVNNDVLWMSIRNLGGPNDQLVSVDPASGAILSGPVDMDASGIPGVTVNDIDAIAWDPVTGQVFGSAGSGAANSLVTINPVTGAVSNVGAFGELGVNPVLNDIEGLGFSNTGADNGVLFGTTGKEDGEGASALFLIDKNDPSASQEVVDLFAATGATDFESVDCLQQLPEPPPMPGVIDATFLTECIDTDGNSGKIVINVSYLSGEDDVDYTVSISGQPDLTGTIGAGDPVEMLMTSADLIDADYQVVVTNNSSDVIVQNQLIPVLCLEIEPPVLNATVVSECIDETGKITVNLNYTAGEGNATFVVNVSGQPEQSLSLAAVGSEMIMYNGLADSDYTVTVNGNGEALANSVQTIDCEVLVPGIDVMLLVNGEDADEVTGPQVATGDQVTLEYKVTNTGASTLSGVLVNDGVQGIVGCPQDMLAPGEMMVCTLTVTAETGQYSSVATASGTDPDGATVNASDPGNFFAGVAAIEVQKLTEGQDVTNAADAPLVEVGDPVTWTYVVTNTGSVDLTNVQLTDAPEGSVSCPQTSLAVDAQMTCQLSGTAIEGEYSNQASVTGTPPSGPNAIDTDDSFYFGANADVMIMKRVNGIDADAAPGPSFDANQTLTFAFDVSNKGNVPLTNVSVNDSDLGAISCPQNTLAVGESFVCTATGPAELGPQSSLATVEGQPPIGSVVTDDDPVNYVGIVEGLVLDKQTNGSDGAVVAAGDTVTWTYIITNLGNQELTGISLVDDPEGAINCPQTALLAGESMTCSASGVAQVGDYQNTGTVTGTTPAGNVLSASDQSSYLGVTGQLGDRVWVDLNVNGLQDPGEPGVEGITVVLWTDDDGDGEPDSRIRDTITGADGTYQFPGLSSTLDYIVQFVVPGNPFTAATGADLSLNSDPDPTTGITGVNSVPAGGSNFSVDAGLLPASLGDKVFIDTNGDGVQQAVEPGVPGIQVVLWTDDDGDGNPDTNTGTATTTDNNGVYAFVGLDPTEDYVVQFISDGRPFTDANVGDDAADSDAGASGITGSYDLDFGENNTTVDAGLIDAPGASVGDIVFSDANENCVADAGEGIAGVTVTLLDSNGNEVAMTTTNGDGMYSFDDLAAGEYTVSVDRPSLPNNFVDTCQDSNSETVTLAEGAVNNAVDFGYAQCAVIGDFVFRDTNGNGVQDAGEPGIGGITINVWVAAADGTPSAQVASDTSATTTGLWSSGCLDPTEDYIVQVGTAGVGLTTQDAGNDDTADSDIDPLTGLSDVIMVSPGDNDSTIDVGLEALEASISINTLTNGDDGVTVETGSDVTFTYMVENTGSVDLENVTVSDTEYGAITCPMDTLAVGAGMTCSLQGTASDEVGSFSNIGAVTANPVGSSAEVTDSDETSHMTFDPAVPIVTINTLTNDEDGYMAEAGETVTITYDVNNPGDVDLTAVTVTDDELGPITCPADVLAAGGTLTCEITAVASDVPGTYTNTGSVTAVGTEGTAVNDSDSTSHIVPEPDPDPDPADVTIVTSTNGEDGIELDIGSTATITYVVTNTGGQNLTDIVVTDSNADVGDIDCPADALAPGDSFTCTATVTVTEGAFSNGGSVSATAPDGTTIVQDSDPTDHEGVDPDPDPDPTPTPTATPVPRNPALTIETTTNGIDADVTGTGPDLTVGSAVQFGYTVTNTGNVPLSNVVVTDSQLGQICTVATLAVNASFPCSRSGIVTAGSYTNRGSVTGADGNTNVSASDPTNHRGVSAVVTPTPTPDAKATATPDAKKATPTPAAKAKATPLAVTGSDSRELATIAIGAIVAGAALVGLGRRRSDGEA